MLLTSFKAVASSRLYQLGDWKAGKAPHPGEPVGDQLYQLGNWKADEETRTLLPLTHIWWPA